MNNGLALSTTDVGFFVTPNQDAGTSATSSRTSLADRATTVGSGSDVNAITATLSFSTINSPGFIEYSVFKAERQFGVPAIGTDPLPTSVNVQNNGLQQESRIQMPGWIVKFGVLPVTAETTKSITIPINLKKFRKAKMRDGDYVGIMIHNRTGGSIVWDLQARYYEYM